MHVNQLVTNLKLSKIRINIFYENIGKFVVDLKQLFIFSSNAMYTFNKAHYQEFIRKWFTLTNRTVMIKFWLTPR